MLQWLLMFERRLLQAGILSGLLAAVSLTAISTAALSAPLRAKPPRQTVEPEARPKGPLTIVVSIARQHLTLYDGLTPIATTTVSTGVSGHETPTGVFSILQKDRYHKSNIYDDAPMPYMQRITWSGVALHEGHVTGRPASHGCIRMPQAFAIRLWKMTRLNVRVIVAYDDVSLAEISAPGLFVVRPEANFTLPIDPPAPISLTTAVDTTASIPESAEKPASDMPAVAEGADKAPPVASLDGETGLVTEAPAPLSLDIAAKPAVPIVNSVAVEAEQSSVAVAASEPVQVEAPAPAAAAPPPSVVATAPVEVLDMSLPPGVGVRKPVEINKSRGPISVFISKKEGKLYVRQDFVPVYETAVTFEDPEAPVGTHVFTAVGKMDGKADSELRWSVATVPSAISLQRDREAAARRLPRKAANGAGVQVASNGALALPLLMPQASEVLQRIKIPDEAGDAIARALTPGSSLIVSDLGNSRETGKGTDFIVLAR
ncbi:L,D-transpeptidase family protein [Roseiarcaceae bacterium H3SJ34-1]|uniref:L,D-transpeptidase n=1 Tax=Terripilifer ovatus TaxID=3032367 RepID=UPI003AB94AF3|nr:L,D-transpeptidase family protein [Roseiarcaceae bacterium H3SJ34-1]